MRDRLLTSLTVAFATLAVVVGLLVPGVAGAAPTGLRPSVQADPTDTTAPADPVTSAPEADAPAAQDEVRLEETDSDAAQRQADEDLRGVWVVVAGLGAVAVGLLVLLVLYVRATKPTRAAARREGRAAKERARARRKAGLPEESPETEVADPGPTPPARPPRAAPVLDLPGLEDDGDEPAVPVEGDDADDAEEVSSPSGAATSPPVPAGDEDEETSRPEVEPVGADAPTAVLSRLDDRDGEEGVKVIGAAARPSTKGPAAPGKPRRRVDAPPKKLATPDAERVLVRPGQAAVRVPAAPSPPTSRPDPDEAPAANRERDEPSAAPEPADDQ